MLKAGGIGTDGVPAIEHGSDQLRDLGQGRIVVVQVGPGQTAHAVVVQGLEVVGHGSAPLEIERAQQALLQDVDGPGDFTALERQIATLQRPARGIDRLLQAFQQQTDELVRRRIGDTALCALGTVGLDGAAAIVGRTEQVCTSFGMADTRPAPWLGGIDFYPLSAISSRH